MAASPPILADSYAIHGMLILLLLNTFLSTHGDMSHACDFYLPWYWAIGSGCFPIVDIISMAVPALFIICSLFYFPPSHPSSHHPSLHRTLPRNGIVFWVRWGWQWGQLGDHDIVCAGGTLRSAFPAVHPPSAGHATPTHHRILCHLLPAHASISRVGGNPLQKIFGTFC